MLRRFVSSFIYETDATFNTNRLKLPLSVMVGIDNCSCYGSGTLYLPAHVALCHMTARLAWRPLFQSLRLFFFFFFLL
jgi:hypothetical protein